MVLFEGKNRTFGDRWLLLLGAIFSTIFSSPLLPQQSAGQGGDGIFQSPTPEVDWSETQEIENI